MASSFFYRYILHFALNINRASYTFKRPGKGKNKATEVTDIEMIHCLKNNDLQIDMGFTPEQQKVYTVNPEKC